MCDAKEDGVTEREVKSLRKLASSNFANFALQVLYAHAPGCAPVK
jgi:hypothetical protein